MSLCAALCRVASRRAVARCTVARCGAVCRGLALCRGGSVEVSLACVVVRSAGRSVAGWWLGGAVRCGCLAVSDPKGNSPSQLHQDLQDEKVPEVYQFQSQDNHVYSDYITMLPTEDIIAQFHKQPHEINFGGTDYQHYFNEKYEYSAPYPTEDHVRAIKNAKLVTPQNITTLNIMANLYESQTKTFIFIPTTNYDFKKDASHNTTAHLNMLLNALASLARATIHVRGTLILLVSDPRVCEATNGIWDYSQAYAKARRFMVDQKISQNFVPLNMILKNDQKPFDTCSAPHPEGYIMITLDNLSEFQYTPPKFSPISPGHDLAHAETFISPQQEAHHTPPITDYIRIDISRDLEVLTEEDAFQFFNKLIKPDLQDASSITSTNCAHYRGEIKKRGSPIGSTHTRFDNRTPTQHSPPKSPKPFNPITH